MREFDSRAEGAIQIQDELSRLIDHLNGGFLRFRAMAFDQPATVAAAAAGSQPTTQVGVYVRNAFVQQFYLLHQSPELVYLFYQESSKLGRARPDSEMESVTTMQIRRIYACNSTRTARGMCLRWRRSSTGACKAGAPLHGLLLGGPIQRQ